MWEKLSSKWAQQNNVIEQAVGNFLIYHDKMFNDCLVKSENKNGYIMTLALTERDDIKLDKDNNILNGNGEIAGVIHQYDRKDDIKNILINKYCPEIMINFVPKNFDFILNIVFLSFILIALFLGIIFLYKIYYKEQSKKINKNFSDIMKYDKIFSYIQLKNI